jgi:N-acetylmuramoyl-L-alanine amidase
MKIINHILCQDDDTAYPYKESPNHSGNFNPKYLIMHYTAGSSAKQSVNWLVNKRARASAHIVIGRDGKITQLVPFNTIAWHAGRSSWDGLNGMNKYSIGIELDNAGPLVRSTDDEWVAWFGVKYENRQVIEARHKNGGRNKGWLLYTPEQLLAALELSSLLVEHYKLKDLVGHEDIAPRRKTDPGPAFPMNSFHSYIFGRNEDNEAEPVEEEQIEQYVTISVLNIRRTPVITNNKLTEGPLPKGTKLLIVNSDGDWRLVNVLDRIRGVRNFEGWVHCNYIRKI